MPCAPLLLALAASPASAEPTTYAVDPDQGLVYVKVLKDESTLMAGASHNHVMRARGFSGTVRWDPADPGACQVAISVPVDQLEVDPQELRDQVGYTKAIKDGDREKIRKHMLAEDQLDAARYPTIDFRSTGCSGADESFTVRGTLSMRGQSVPVSVLMRIVAGQGELSAAGQLETTHTAFGFQPYSAALGALKNRDQLRFFVHVLATAP